MGTQNSPWPPGHDPFRRRPPTPHEPFTGDGSQPTPPGSPRPTLNPFQASPYSGWSSPPAGSPPLPETGHPWSGGSPFPGLPNPAASETKPRPWTVWLATISLASAAALAITQIIAGVFGVLRVAEAVEGVGNVEPTGTVTVYVGSKVDTVQSWVIAVVIVVGVLFAACYVVFAFAAWRGRSWPRYAATVLALFSLFGLLGGPVVIGIVVCGLTATAAMWSPQSRTYSAIRRMHSGSSAGMRTL